MKDGKKRIVVAMSGGVDSSVAAALLAGQGHEVIGITLRLWTPSPWNNGERYGGCCSPQDVSDAKQVARQLGVPHYTYDLEEKFREKVVDNFVSEYLEGRTPNPCVRCNSFIKFDILLKYALALDADLLATGHYAQIENGVRGRNPNGVYRLSKARDSSKDQSYFLYMLNQSHLSRLVFPLGGYAKSEVREMARKFELVNACKKDSQDVCFLEGRNYREFLSERISQDQVRKGEIRTTDGAVVGTHQGLHNYTVGQREKLGISMGRRYYVINKDVENNRLIVGTEEENRARGCEALSVSWCSSSVPDGPVKALVKIRYRHQGVSAMIVPSTPDQAQIIFDEPQPSVTRGQSVVFYDGDHVLGGGIIERIL